MKSFLIFIFFIGHASLLNIALAHDFTLGIGNLSEYIRKFQTDDSGTISVINFNPLLKAHYEYNLNEKFSLYNDKTALMFNFTDSIYYFYDP